MIKDDILILLYFWSNRWPQFTFSDHDSWGAIDVCSLCFSTPQAFWI